ncbi:MAG: RagB/SusD family nutrient uptake outer membrane protein [Sediminicola sp.]
MNLHKLVYAFSGILFLASCEKELEIDPTDNLPGDQAFTSELNISSILVGTYEEAGQPTTYGGNLQMTTDLLGTLDQAFWLGTFLDPRQAFTKSLLVDNGWVEDIWANAYETINQANLVIDNLDIVTSSEAERNRIEGEAKFLRALNYFDLVRNFGAPYETGQPNSQLGVPLRLEGIIEYSLPQPIARSTVGEVYAQIISDATNAYELLPSENSFYADRYAAQALLARIYFQQGEYAAARDAAHDVLENSGHSLATTFASAFNNDVDSPEDIFTFQVTSQTGINNLVTHYASEGDGGRGGDIVVEDAYLELFDDPNDERGSFVYINPDNDRRLTLKYTNQFANVIIFRIAEMHLIRAESNFREGTVVGLEPLLEINALRGRSGAAALDGPLTLELLARERQLELAFEGFLLNDIKRTQGSVGDIPWDDTSLYFPIPQTEMDTNPLMEQNEGYD